MYFRTDICARAGGVRATGDRAIPHPACVPSQERACAGPPAYQMQHRRTWLRRWAVFVHPDFLFWGTEGDEEQVWRCRGNCLAYACVLFRVVLKSQRRAICTGDDEPGVFSSQSLRRKMRSHRQSSQQEDAEAMQCGRRAKAFHQVSARDTSLERSAEQT